MPNVIEGLLKQNLYGVFGEHNAEKRRAAIADIWAQDAVFIDPDGRHLGQAALDEAVVKLQSRFPAYVFSEIRPVQAFHGVGRLPWAFGPANDPTKITGLDLALVSGGRLSTLYTFLDPPRETGAP
jgi:hypothetical protein